MKRIPLTQGLFALVSDNQYDRVRRFDWYALRDEHTYYAIRRLPGIDKKQKLHRFILGIDDPLIKIDHKDGNGLNCQDDNLRISTTAQNDWNRGIPSNNTSGYKGVSWHKRKRRWQTSIMANGKKIWGGQYKTAIEAAIEYNRLAIKYHGEFAWLNEIPNERIGE